MRVAHNAFISGMLLLCCIAMVACGSDESRSTDSDRASRAVANAPVAIRIMTFNIEWGGTHVRFASIPEAILASGADIVGIQEAEGNLARLANDLGWHYSLRNYVVSKYPLIDPGGADGKYVLVEVSPGRAIAVSNVHLPSYPSGAAWLRAGRTTGQVLAMERRVRLSKLRPFLDVLPDLQRQAVPVFLIGDFNAPSHQDWTRAAIGRFPHRDRTIDWPATRAAQNAGLRDAFRDTHKNPVTRPGFTWWAKRPEIPAYNPDDPTRQDRIDYLWYGGAARAVDSRLIGEVGGPGVAVSVTPWPSDHRAVVGDFEVIPAPVPFFIAAGRRVHHAGRPLRFFFRNSSTAGSVAVEFRGSTPRVERRIALDRASGVLEIPDAFLRSGYYQVVLYDDTGQERAQNDFWILKGDATPVVAVGGQTFTTGQALPLTWSNAPANRNDWLGVFDTATADQRQYLAWAYTGAASSGELQLSQETAEDGWPLPPGQYVVRLLLDDGFGLLAESGVFTVE